MGKLIELKAPRANLARPPADTWALRWRLSLVGGLTVTSAWTPQTEYPSIRKTLQDFADRIDAVFVDGVNRFTGDKATFLRCEGSAFAALSYKMMVSGASGRQIIAGIEVQDRDGDCYLVLRDGTVYEERKEAHVANHD